MRREKTNKKEWQPVKLSTRLLLSTAIFVQVGVFGFAGTSLAQDEAAPKSGSNLEEIVVTAQFTEESVQATPLSISAFSGDGLANMGVEAIEDLGMVVPNLTMKPAGALYGPAVQVYIRGVGQRDTTLAREPGVGMYVDDVYYSTLLGSAFDLIDVSRVEVLRGPQGTLAGKNALGGAVRVFSKKPTGDGSGYIELTGGSYDRIDFRAGYDAELLKDQLFARFSAVSRHRKGYFKRIDYGCENPGSGVPTYSISEDCVLGTEGGQDMHAGRIALRWLPNERWEVNVAADLTDDNSETSPQQLLGTTNPLLTNMPGVDFTTNPGDMFSYANFVDTGERIDGFTGRPSSVPAIAHIQSYGFSANIDWRITDNISLKSITAYRKVNASNANDFDASPLDVTLAFTNTNIEQTTQELRLSGQSFGHVLDWTVGGFYFDGLGHKGGPTWSQPVTAFASIITGTDEVITESRAVFGHAVFHVTDQLDVVAGLRYTDDYKSYEFQRRDPENPSQPAVIGRAGPLDGIIGIAESTNTDYRLGVNYQVTDDVMVYGQYATGYKGGGVNPRPFNPSQLLSHDPEGVRAYEIGFKSDLLDDTLRFNASAFISSYDNIIVTLTRPAPRQVPTNAGAADIKGVEVETVWVPNDNLTVDASISWLDFEYKDLSALALESGIPADGITPYTPKWKWHIGAQYEFDLASGAKITTRLDASYQSDIFSLPNNTDRDRVDAYVLVNGRVTWVSASEDWSAALSVTNLTDKSYYLNKHSFSFPLALDLGQPGRPREWAFSVTRRF